MEKHFTATTYLLHEGKTLLHLHPKLGKYLPPGGHIEKNETPSDAAKREVFEESGLIIEFISQENIWIENRLAKSIERPFMCLLETVETPYLHQHIDLIFLAKPIGNITPQNNQFQWFSLDEALQLSPIFEDTKQVISKILNEMAFKEQ